MTTEEQTALEAMGAELTAVGDTVLELKTQQEKLGGKVSLMRTETNQCLDSLCDTSELLVANLRTLMDHFGVVHSLDGHVILRPGHTRRARVGDSEASSEA